MMTSKFYKFTLSAGAAVSLVGVNGVAHADTETGTATAGIATPIVATKISDLDSGTMAVGTTGGVVEIRGTGVTCPAGITCIGTGTAASWDVTSDINQYVYWDGPANITLSNGSGGTMPMFVVGLNSIHHNTTGTFTMELGGDLTIAPNQPSGNYSGTMEVTFIYQ